MEQDRRPRPQPGARDQEGRAQPERSAHEDAQGMAAGVAERSARVAPRHQDAHLPPGRRRNSSAIAAFIWQSGVTGDLPHQPPGDPEKGKEAFETRGCMACHSMGEGGEKQGGTFAANLSRVGEKDNYDYLVRWVHNPRQRTLPYCPFEKKRYHRRRLQARRPAFRLRPGSRQVPQRRPSIAGDADDSHAQPAAYRRRSARYRQLSGDPQARRTRLTPTPIIWTIPA